MITKVSFKKELTQTATAFLMVTALVGCGKGNRPEGWVARDSLLSAKCKSQADINQRITGSFDLEAMHTKSGKYASELQVKTVREYLEEQFLAVDLSTVRRMSDEFKNEQAHSVLDNIALDLKIAQTPVRPLTDLITEVSKSVATKAEDTVGVSGVLVANSELIRVVKDCESLQAAYHGPGVLSQKPNGKSEVEVRNVFIGKIVDITPTKIVIENGTDKVMVELLNAPNLKDKKATKAFYSKVYGGELDLAVTIEKIRGNVTKKLFYTQSINRNTQTEHAAKMSESTVSDIIALALSNTDAEKVAMAAAIRQTLKNTGIITSEDLATLASIAEQSLRGNGSILLEQEVAAVLEIEDAQTASAPAGDVENDIAPAAVIGDATVVVTDEVVESANDEEEVGNADEEGSTPAVDNSGSGSDDEVGPGSEQVSAAVPSPNVPADQSEVTGATGGTGATEETATGASGGTGASLFTGSKDQRGLRW